MNAIIRIKEEQIKKTYKKKRCFQLILCIVLIIYKFQFYFII